MRKFTLAIMAGLLFVPFANAQMTDNSPMLPAPTIQKTIPAASRATNSFYIDYDYYEENLLGAAAAGGPPGVGYRRYYTTMNAYKWLTRYFVVAFDSIMDSYNDISYDKSTFNQIRVDTAFFYFSHVNRSGTADTLEFNLIGLDAAGRPLESVVYASQEIITSTSLSTSITDFLVEPIAFEETLPMGVKNFGLSMKLRGDTLDSMAQIFGFYDLDASACSNSTVTILPAPSMFAVNTFIMQGRYATSLGLIPTTTGADFYFDCDGSGGRNAGDGASQYQNLAMWVHVTTDPPSSVGETDGISSVNAYPNPARDVLNMNYNSSVAGNSDIRVYDITGKTVLNKRYENLAGKNNLTLDISSLENGLYFYELGVEGNKASGKFTVVK